MLGTESSESSMAMFDRLMAQKKQKAEEAEQKKRAEIASRTIGCEIPPVTLEDFVAGKGRWSEIHLVRLKEIEDEKKAKRDGNRLVEIPEPEFDPFDVADRSEL